MENKNVQRHPMKPASTSSSKRRREDDNNDGNSRKRSNPNPEKSSVTCKVATTTHNRSGGISSATIRSTTSGNTTIAVSYSSSFTIRMSGSSNTTISSSSSAIVQTKSSRTHLSKNISVRKKEKYEPMHTKKAGSTTIRVSLNDNTGGFIEITDKLSSSMKWNKKMETEATSRNDNISSRSLSLKSKARQINPTSTLRESSSSQIKTKLAKSTHDKHEKKTRDVTDNRPRNTPKATGTNESANKRSNGAKYSSKNATIGAKEGAPSSTNQIQIKSEPNKQGASSSSTKQVQIQSAPNKQGAAPSSTKQVQIKSEPNTPSTSGGEKQSPSLKHTMDSQAKTNLVLIKSQKVKSLLAPERLQMREEAVQEWNQVFGSEYTLL